MTRNHEHPKDFKPRYLAAATLAVCAFNLSGGVVTVAKPDAACIDIDNLNAPSASAVYDVENGSLRTVTGEMPEIHENSYATLIPNALPDPVVRLALKTGDVTSVTANIAEPMQGNPLFSSFSTEGGIYDNDAHCGTEKEIVLSFDPKRATDPETGLFADEYAARLLVVHEALHGLNDEWWHRIKEAKAFDSIQDPKIYELQNACNDINKWLSYQNTGKMPQSIPYPDDLTVADICSTQAMTMDTDPLREMFRCVNEGNMLMDRRKLKSTASLGHPWDNPTELASSITNLLKFDPGYIYQCLDTQDGMDATLIKSYVKATLELSFAHMPELEQLLRQDKNTSEAIDFLLSAS